MSSLVVEPELCGSVVVRRDGQRCGKGEGPTGSKVLAPPCECHHPLAELVVTVCQAGLVGRGRYMETSERRCAGISKRKTSSSVWIPIKLIHRTNKKESETWKDAAPVGRFATGSAPCRYSPTAVTAVGANAKPAPPAWLPLGLPL